MGFVCMHCQTSYTKTHTLKPHHPCNTLTQRQLHPPPPPHPMQVTTAYYAKFSPLDLAQGACGDQDRAWLIVLIAVIGLVGFFLTLSSYEMRYGQGYGSLQGGCPSTVEASLFRTRGVAYKLFALTASVCTTGRGKSCFGGGKGVAICTEHMYKTYAHNVCSNIHHCTTTLSSQQHLWLPHYSHLQQAHVCFSSSIRMGFYSCWGHACSLQLLPCVLSWGLGDLWWSASARWHMQHQVCVHLHCWVVHHQWYIHQHHLLQAGCSF